MDSLRRFGRTLKAGFLLLLLPVFALVVLLPVLSIFFQFELHAPLMRGVAMAFGKTGKGFVTHKYPPDRTWSHYRLSVNFQCRDGVALHEYLPVGPEGFDKVALDQEIAIRYLPRFCSWVVLEDDAGYARGTIGLFLKCVAFGYFMASILPALRRRLKRRGLLGG